MFSHRRTSTKAYWTKLNGDLMRVFLGIGVGFGLGFYTCYLLLH